MTKLQILQLMGQAIQEVDTAIGNLLPSDPKQQRLQNLRVTLDQRQRQMAAQIFNESDPAFQKAAQQLQAANAGIQASLQNLQNIENTIANVAQFVNAVTSILSTAGVLV